MRIQSALRATSRVVMAAGRTIERLVDYQQYRRSLNAGVAGKGQRIFYEKELFGVDTRPEWMRTEQRTPRR